MKNEVEGAMFYRVIRLLLIVFLSIGLTACTPNNIVNKIELIQTIGFDTSRTGVKSTVLVSRYMEKGQPDLQLLDTESNSIYDTVPRLNTKTPQPIEYGQLRMVLFGKHFSENGVSNELESLIRDPKISSRLQLAVADRDASELMEIIRKSKKPYFLSDMIEQNMKSGNVPSSNLHTSLFNFYGEGRDMFLPRVTVERGNVKIDGLVLFRNDKKAAEIDIKDTFLLKMLIEDSKGGSYMVPLESILADSKPNEFILVNSIHSKAKYSINSTNLVPTVSIHLRMQVSVTDITSRIDLMSQETLLELEKNMGLFFQSKASALLSFCKKNHVDPIGLGDFIRSRSTQWNAEHYNEIYSELTTNVSVEVKIVNTGTGE
ncbi:Ger(x)C family spore germination protein [Paenibacillus sp. GD4]|uniref:Ger(x)C family spore germination protein n=1 Tax=Paenibacillus sp. GD4 TaxID=3068890 RepID=UPI0027967334|nr:Ger(x)C family spore germination protein [Paenibacillus sp. GD4]MDQ1913688.1 Ger(x)C family spore germination protein [Paenibacillus sp. GD4]